MLEQLDALCREHGIFRTSLLRQKADLPSAGAYTRQFGSLDLAFQQIHDKSRDQARELVHERICQSVPEVLPYSDFLVLGRKLTVSIAPAVPIPHGYSAYWPIRPDERKIIDMTLGVLLSDTDATEILGYVALPRLLAGSRTLRFGSASMRTELFGRCDLNFLQQLL